MPRALAISAARGVTIHASLYIALAQERHIPLVTANMGLIRRPAGGAALTRHMVWVGDIQA